MSEELFEDFVERKMQEINTFVSQHTSGGRTYDEEKIIEMQEWVNGKLDEIQTEFYRRKRGVKG